MGVALPLALVAAIGVASVAFGDTLSRAGRSGGYVLFWIGLGLIYLPITARMTSANAGRNERFALVVVAALALYAVKVVYSPNAFVFHDEFAHLRTTHDIASTGGLFSYNPLIPVTARYPGLGLATIAVAKLTGLSIVTSGFLVIGTARLLLALTVFLLLERISGSARIAGLGSLLYMANPDFLLWSSQFAYESLALPLALTVVLLLDRAASSSTPGRWRMLALLTALAVVVIHHMTAAIMALLCLSWWVVGGTTGHRTRRVDSSQLAVAVTTTAALAIWIALVAPDTVDYLRPVLSRAVAETGHLVLGQTPPRHLYTSATGHVAPLWERAAGFTAVMFILVALPFGLLKWWQRRRTSSALFLLMGATVIIYPLTLVMRLTTAGAETSNRSSEFLFLGLGLIVGLAVEWWLRSNRSKAVRIGAATAALAVIFTGGVTAGWTHSLRLPPAATETAPPAVPGPDSFQLASWASHALGSHRSFAAGGVEELVLGGYGSENPVSGHANHTAVWPLFEEPRVGRLVRLTIRHGRIRYLVVDSRMAKALPLSGQYFETGEPAQRRPISALALFKFDLARSVDRIYDDGTTVIYDVSALSSTGKAPKR